MVVPMSWIEVQRNYLAGIVLVYCVFKMVKIIWRREWYFFSP